MIGFGLHLTMENASDNSGQIPIWSTVRGGDPWNLLSSLILALGLVIIPRPCKFPWLKIILSILMIMAVSLLRYFAFGFDPLHSSMAMVYLTHAIDGMKRLPINSTFWYIMGSAVYVMDLAVDIVIDVYFQEYLLLSRLMGGSIYLIGLIIIGLYFVLSFEIQYRWKIALKLANIGAFMAWGFVRILAGQSTVIVAVAFMACLAGYVQTDRGSRPYINRPPSAP